MFLAVYPETNVSYPDGMTPRFKSSFTKLVSHFDNQSVGYFVKHVIKQLKDMSISIMLLEKSYISCIMYINNQINLHKTEVNRTFGQNG